ncbi:TrmB family transcriptional regulator [Candidatus Woesearchaeota archaeon]|jgi:sugar-specific transcriptional regulator TrmB|nr:TrmB family transcriptional regulator [Candidatus Woesearchaeota archaeon]MBT4110744.1 TrmB family transcriptional regulator [Candidatus Woesearchaeota archaeon]MBT4336340.1 TrmB family transcriptional regulator [Candidatus Woesearchaeota archaeon]MBT4469299.1 TrmB family transcriptional regulator [Candidatus Woesearchaeota archaeon]MBT6743878.1 TrmB family transcriptional regulator [Candidatus Woesearchaeota archaeon]
MDNIIKALKSFGLTEYEAKVYNALLNQNISTATEISTESKVPRARIYDVLSSLARKGWVQILDTTPIKYSLVDINHVKKKLKQIEEEMKKASEFVIEELASKIKNENELSSEIGSDLFVETKRTLNLLSRTISLAEKNISIHYLNKKWLEKLMIELTKAKKRGVEIRILLNKKDDSLSFKRKLLTFAQVKVSKENVIHGNILVDYSFYCNTYYKSSGLQAQTIGYKKCIHCLHAWIKREWEES